MISQLYEAEAFSHTHLRAKLHTVRRRNSIFQLLLTLSTISSAIGKVEEIPSRHEPVRDRLRGSPKTFPHPDIVANERELDANMASSPKVESADIDPFLSNQSRVLNLAKIASGSCYIIRSPSTQGYISIDGNGRLYSTQDNKLARTFCVENIKGNRYRLTVKNEDGSSSYITPSPGRRRGLKMSADVSPPVGFRRNRDGTYGLQYDGDRWIDKGIKNRLAVVTSDECYGCRSSKFELLNPPEIDILNPPEIDDNQEEEVPGASLRMMDNAADTVDVLDTPRYPSGRPP